MLTKQTKRFFSIIGLLLIVYAVAGIYRAYQTYNYKISLYGVEDYDIEKYREKSGIEQEYLSTVTLTDGTVIENFTVADLEAYDLRNKNNSIQNNSNGAVRVYPTQIVNYYLDE